MGSTGRIGAAQDEGGNFSVGQKEGGRTTRRNQGEPKRNTPLSSTLKCPDRNIRKMR